MTEDAAEFTLVLFIALGLALGYRMRSLALWRDHGASDRHPFADLELRILGALTLASLVLLPVVDALVPWFEFADSPFRTTLAWLGTGLATTAVWIFWRAHYDLYNAGSAARSTPLEAGVYRFVRHPLYTALLFWALAQWLLSQNWISGVLAVVTFLALYVLRVPREEQQLLERHGHRYLEYMDRTGSLLPRWTADRQR